MFPTSGQAISLEDLAEYAFNTLRRFPDVLVICFIEKTRYAKMREIVIGKKEKEESNPDSTTRGLEADRLYLYTTPIEDAHVQAITGAKQKIIYLLDGDVHLKPEMMREIIHPKCKTGELHRFTLTKEDFFRLERKF